MSIKLIIRLIVLAVLAMLITWGNSLCAELTSQNGARMDENDKNTVTHASTTLWQSWSFREFVLLELLGVGGAFYIWRTRRLERQRIEQLAFSRRLMVSQEQERERIAAGLHDSLGQNLLVIKNRAVIGLAHSDQPAEMAKQLAEISTMASLVIREVREIAQNLRPYQLDDLGLAKAITAMARAVSAASNIEIRTKLDALDGTLLPEFEINIYRIIQECLNNIVKHSKATTVSIETIRRDRRVHLIIRDNGCGFDAIKWKRQPDERRGFGLRNIEERARMMGGLAWIRSESGTGTTLELEAPVKPDSAQPITVVPVPRPNSLSNETCTEDFYRRRSPDVSPGCP